MIEFKKEDIYKIETWNGQVRIQFKSNFIVKEIDFMFDNSLLFNSFIHDLINKYDLYKYTDFCNSTCVYLVNDK